MESDAIAKVLLPLRGIPDGATIFKVKGMKPYIVRESLTVYNADMSDDIPQSIKTKGVRFLVCPERGDINAYSDSTEVVWHVAPHEKPELAAILGISAADCADAEDFF